MSMSDIISHLGLTLYPIAGMVIFLSVFVGVVVRVMQHKRREELDRAATLPLEDDRAMVRGRENRQ